MSVTRYVIMANGRGMRWGGHLGIPKHLITVDDETLLQRLVRQIADHAGDPDIVISSSDPRYDTPGARRHEPVTNELEIDRFPPELITEPVCFLYGDTYYTDRAMARIVEPEHEEDSPLRFYGDERSIVAVKAREPEAMLTHIRRVRELYLAGKIASCIGWHVYHSFTGLPFEGNQIGRHFERLDGETAGFNKPDDLKAFRRNYDLLSAGAERVIDYEAGGAGS